MGTVVWWGEPIRVNVAVETISNRLLTARWLFLLNESPLHQNLIGMPPANAMVDGAGQLGIGYLAILAA
jgi:hypothetical protein